jgi:hypothetical protein
VPEADGEHEQEHSRQVRAELVADPGAGGGVSSEVAARVIDDAELVRLDESPGDRADHERRACDQAAVPRHGGEGCLGDGCGEHSDSVCLL